MKDLNKIRKNIEGTWYYKCTACKKWKIETDFGCDNHNKIRNHHTSRCKECLHIINHYDKGYKSFRTPSIKGNKLYCTCCEQYKDFCEFGNYSSNINRNGKAFKCKDCERCQLDMYYHKLNSDRDKAIDRLLSIRINAAKKRAIKKHLDFDIDVPFLKELWDKQKGLCNISKIPMTLYFKNNVKNYNLSVDRIDSTKGYTKDNVQLVCDIINRMKLDLEMNKFVELCKIIYNEQNRIKFS